MKQDEVQYIDLSWAVVAVCESEQFLWSELVRDQDVTSRVEHYVIGYMSFWHIAFVEKELLVPCDNQDLRETARRKIACYIAQHPPVRRLPRFYLVLLQQSIAPQDPDGLSRVYQV